MLLLKIKCFLVVCLCLVFYSTGQSNTLVPLIYSNKNKTEIVKVLAPLVKSELISPSEVGSLFSSVFECADFIDPIVQINYVATFKQNTIPIIESLLKDSNFQKSYNTGKIKNVTKKAEKEIMCGNAFAFSEGILHAQIIKKNYQNIVRQGHQITIPIIALMSANFQSCKSDVEEKNGYSAISNFQSLMRNTFNFLQQIDGFLDLYNQRLNENEDAPVELIKQRCVATEAYILGFNVGIFTPNEIQSAITLARERKEREEQVLLVTRKKSNKLLEESLNKRERIYEYTSGELKQVLIALDKSIMEMMRRDLSKITNICKQTGSCILNDFQDDQKHQQLIKSSKDFFAKLSKKSRSYELENDNLRLALDILNYLFTGDKTKRKIGLLSPKSCIFFKRGGFLTWIEVIALDQVIKETAKLNFDNEYQFQGDTPVIYEISPKYFSYYKSVMDTIFFSEKFDISTKKLGTIRLHEDIDIQRAMKATSLLFSKSCTGKNPSEF